MSGKIVSILESIEQKFLLIIGVLLFVVVLILILVMRLVASPLLTKVTPVFQLIFWPYFWYMFRRYGRLTVYGKDNLKNHIGAAIFAANHTSKWDSILIPATLNPLKRGAMYYVSRKSRDDPKFYNVPWYLKWLVGGLVFKGFGACPALPKLEGYERKLGDHIQLLSEGKNVCIFPEGDRLEGKTLGTGKPGVAYLLWKTGIPVIPTAIHGHKGMGISELFNREHRIVVSYGEPITRGMLFSDIEVEPTHEELINASQFIMQRIRQQLLTSGYEEGETPSCPKSM